MTPIEEGEKSNPYPPLICEVCNGESGGTFVGVASITGMPMSIAWCSECLKRDSAPAFVFDYEFIFEAEGNIELLNSWVRARETWVDGHYITFDDYVTRITPDQVRKTLDDYESERRARNSESPAEGPVD